MAVIADSNTFFAADRAAWREWLERHHAARTPVLAPPAADDVEEPNVRYDEAVEEALCWGWIDGLTKRCGRKPDYAVRFTPRKPGSVSIGEQRRASHPDDRRGADDARGRSYEAKRRGAWDEAASGRLFDVTPPDLEAALAGVPAAQEQWATWAPSHRRQYIYWVLDAKRPETRARRVADVVRRAAAGIRPGEPA